MFQRLHRLKKRIRLPRIKHLIRPHECHEVLGLGQVHDVVRIHGQHVDGLFLLAADLELGHQVCPDPIFLDQDVATCHDEEFPLTVVPIPAFCDGMRHQDILLI